MIKIHCSGFKIVLKMSWKIYILEISLLNLLGNWNFLFQKVFILNSDLSYENLLNMHKNCVSACNYFCIKNHIFHVELYENVVRIDGQMCDLTNHDNNFM